MRPVTESTRTHRWPFRPSQWLLGGYGGRCQLQQHCEHVHLQRGRWWWMHTPMPKEPLDKGFSWWKALKQEDVGRESYGREPEHIFCIPFYSSTSYATTDPSAPSMPSLGSCYARNFVRRFGSTGTTDVWERSIRSTKMFRQGTYLDDVLTMMTQIVVREWPATGMYR
jgi:hypothetical protein